MPRAILIDTDTASDDAVALIMALRSSVVEVKAITTVAGNVPVKQATSNALYTTEICDSDVPVFMGAASPLKRELQTASWFHGMDGLGDHGYAPAHRTVQKEDAISALIRCVREHPGLEVITLGPLTNLALALSREPGLADSLSRLVVMGGAPCTEGNVTPAAEFNIWVDPEAAQVVFRSGLPIEMIGWQLSRGAAVVSADEIERLNASRTRLADFAVRCNSTGIGAFREQTGEVGISLPDPVAMAVLLDPALALRSSSHYVEVETQSELTRGMTVVDRLNVASNPRNRAVWFSALQKSRPVRICWDLDVPGWKEALFSALV